MFVLFLFYFVLYLLNRGGGSFY